MRLEAGRTYRTRDGDEVTPASSDDSWYPFKGTINGAVHSWTKEGTYWWGLDDPCRFDLVEEVLELEQVTTTPAPTVIVTVPEGVNVEIKYAS